MLSLTQGGHSWEERYNSKGKCQGLWDRGGTPNTLQTEWEASRRRCRVPASLAKFYLPWNRRGEGRWGVSRLCWEPAGKDRSGWEGRPPSGYVLSPWVKTAPFSKSYCNYPFS